VQGGHDDYLSNIVETIPPQHLVVIGEIKNIFIFNIIIVTLLKRI
jgi:hypothetical protein